MVARVRCLIDIPEHKSCFTITIDNWHIGNESKYIFVNLKPMFCISRETSMCKIHNKYIVTFSVQINQNSYIYIYVYPMDVNN